VVVAAALGLQLCREEVKIDPCGKGYCNYRRRPLGADDELTKLMGESTIMSLCAGLIAQRIVIPDCPKGYGTDDYDQIRDHLREMFGSDDSDGAKKVLEKCQAKAAELVKQHLDAIRELSEDLWEQNWMKRTDNKDWSNSVLEKKLDWQRVQEILKRNKIDVCFYAEPED
jgi:hypothetical protein